MDGGSDIKRQRREPESTAHEVVLAVIPRVKPKSGLMGVGNRYHTLILTDRRVIFARAGMKQRAASPHDGATPGSQKPLARLGAAVGALMTWNEERYFEMPPDQALAEASANFAIERSSITHTLLKTKKVRGDGYVDRYELLFISTVEKQYEILLAMGGMRQAKKALKAAGMR